MNDPGDRQEFAHLMQGLFAVYDIEPTTAKLAGYWMGLQDLSMSDVRNAVGRAIKAGGRFMPKPAELRELSGEATPALRAARAWEQVKRSIRSVGAYQSVRFDDPIAGQVVRNLGGWVALCNAEPDELAKWTRAKFEKLYVEMTVSGAPPEMPILRGLHSLDAAVGQFEEPPPVLIRIEHGPPPARALEGKESDVVDQRGLRRPEGGRPVPAVQGGPRGPEPGALPALPKTGDRQRGQVAGEEPGQGQ